MDPTSDQKAIDDMLTDIQSNRTSEGYFPSTDRMLELNLLYEFAASQNDTWRFHYKAAEYGTLASAQPLAMQGGIIPTPGLGGETPDLSGSFCGVGLNLSKKLKENEALAFQIYREGVPVDYLIVVTDEHNREEGCSYAERFNRTRGYDPSLVDPTFMNFEAGERIAMAVFSPEYVPDGQDEPLVVGKLFPSAVWRSTIILQLSLRVMYNISNSVIRSALGFDSLDM